MCTTQKKKLNVSKCNFLSLTHAHRTRRVFVKGIIRITLCKKKKKKIGRFVLGRKTNEMNRLFGFLVWDRNTYLCERQSKHNLPQCTNTLTMYVAVGTKSMTRAAHIHHEKKKERESEFTHLPSAWPHGEYVGFLLFFSFFCSFDATRVKLAATVQQFCFYFTSVQNNDRKR